MEVATSVHSLSVSETQEGPSLEVTLPWYTLCVCKPRSAIINRSPLVLLVVVVVCVLVCFWQLGQLSVVDSMYHEVCCMRCGGPRANAHGG